MSTQILETQDLPSLPFLQKGGDIRLHYAHFADEEIKASENLNDLPNTKKRQIKDVNSGQHIYLHH